MLNVGGLTRCTTIDYPGKLAAVVFSGGATMQTGLVAAISTVKELGFLVGIHTAGAIPEVVEQVLPLMDWVGMDIKAPFEEYEEVTGAHERGAGTKK